MDDINKSKRTNAVLNEGVINVREIERCFAAIFSSFHLGYAVCCLVLLFKMFCTMIWLFVAFSRLLLWKMSVMEDL